MSFTRNRVRSSSPPEQIANLPAPPRDLALVTPLVAPLQKASRRFMRLSLVLMLLVQAVSVIQTIQTGPARDSVFWQLMALFLALQAGAMMGAMKAGAWWAARKHLRFLRLAQVTTGRVLQVKKQRSLTQWFLFGRDEYLLKFEYRDPRGALWEAATGHLATRGLPCSLVEGGPILVLFREEQPELFGVLTPEGGLLHPPSSAAGWAKRAVLPQLK